MIPSRPLSSTDLSVRIALPAPAKKHFASLVLVLIPQNFVRLIPKRQEGQVIPRIRSRAPYPGPALPSRRITSDTFLLPLFSGTELPGNYAAVGLPHPLKYEARLSLARK